MENAVDAIKIAFGVLVFIIALTLAVSVIGQARAASDVIFHLNDKTEFYEYVTSENIETSEERIVGMATVLPTIHRYYKEQYAVTIFKSNGEMYARYDLWTEGLMSDWDQVLKNYNKAGSSESIIYAQVKERLQKIQDSVNQTLDTNRSFDMNKILDLYAVSSTNNTNIKVGAPWIGSTTDILDRIKCDMVGGKYERNGIEYSGKNLRQYQNNKFKEKFIEITTSGETITDEEYSLDTIKGNKKLEIIYILQE